MTQQLTKHREVFLAIGLTSTSSSAIEGINRRFPEAWNCREKYLFYKHYIFKDVLLQQEYRYNLAYCLFEYSNSYEPLKSALIEHLGKKETKIYKVVKKTQKNPCVTLEDLLNQCEICGDISYMTIADYKKIAVLDFFIDYYGIELDKTSSEQNLISLFQEKGDEFIYKTNVKINEDFILLKQQLRRENTEHYKIHKSWFKQYIDFINISQATFLSFEYLFESNDSFCELTQLGIKFENKKSRLTLQEGIELIALVRCVQRSLMPCCHDTERLEEEDLLYIFDHVKPMLSQYLVMTHHELDRDYFFKNYCSCDNTTIKSFENALEREKNKVNQIQKKHDILLMKTNEMKENFEKEYTRKIKSMTTDLITLNRENEKLLQENEKLKAQLKEHTTYIQEDNGFVIENLNEIQDLEIDLEIINDPSILIVGGATATIQRLKQKLPKCKYFEVDQKYNDHFFNGIKQAILLTNIMNHGMTYRVDKLCPKIPKKSIGSTNVDRIIHEIAIQVSSIDKN